MTTATISPVDYCRYLVDLELIALDQARRRKVLAAMQTSCSSTCSSTKRKFSQHHDSIADLFCSGLSGKLHLIGPSTPLSMPKFPLDLCRDVIKLPSKVPTEEEFEADENESSSSDVSYYPPAKRAKHKDVRWMANLNALREYKAKHGDCIVPRGYSANPQLASWVAEQRKQRKLLQSGKQSSMIPSREKLLDEVGFVWNAQEAAWERQMEDLKMFRKEEGHCLVPVGHAKYPKLGSWVKEQRRHYVLMKQGKQSNMSEERSAKLDAIGFCWNTHEALWLERFHELSEYKKTRGHSIVPTKCHENQRLGTWVHHQRREYKKYQQGKPSHMTAERIQALETLDFVWYPRESNRSDSGSVCSSSSSS
eukprot:scaffold24077_cov117-Cylindrotheca_fusiformis.AAC.1